MEDRKYYGKYPGTVVQNIDPENRGRLMCEVTDVLGFVPGSWAECCAPLAGPVGPPMGAYLVPPIGAGVWIEFMYGDPSKPIWTGCRFGSAANVPPIARLGLPVSPSIVLQTAGQNALVISDTPGPQGGIMIKSTTNAFIIVNDTGIYISNGKGATITMVGKQIDINQGAITVLN
jgi:uncharacterized protein involved in type VI secretion and phage assembly